MSQKRLSRLYHQKKCKPKQHTHLLVADVGFEPTILSL
jgi:hypothetical protein